MSELKEVWVVKEQGLWQKCPKYGILVSGCSKYFECNRCMGRKPKDSIKRSKKKSKDKCIKVKKITKRMKKNRNKPALNRNKVGKFKMARTQRTL